MFVLNGEKKKTNEILQYMSKERNLKIRQLCGPTFSRIYDSKMTKYWIKFSWKWKWGMLSFQWNWSHLNRNYKTSDTN